MRTRPFLLAATVPAKAIFETLDFLAEAMSSSLQSVFDRRGGIGVVRNRTSGKGYPPNLGLGAVLGKLNGEIESARYAFEVRATKNYGFEVLREQCVVHLGSGGTSWFDRGRKNFRSNVEGLKPALEPASLGLPVIGGEASFAPVLRTLAGDAQLFHRAGQNTRTAARGQRNHPEKRWRQRRQCLDGRSVAVLPRTLSELASCSPASCPT